MFGSRGNDRPDGGYGNDGLNGGRGDNMMFGDYGADTFVFGIADSGHDRILDFNLAWGQNSGEGDNILFAGSAQPDNFDDLTFEVRENVVWGFSPPILTLMTRHIIICIMMIPACWSVGVTAQTLSCRRKRPGRISLKKVPPLPEIYGAHAHQEQGPACKTT